MARDPTGRDVATSAGAAGPEPDAPRARLYSPTHELQQARREIAAWLGRVRDRTQPDPRRWTPVGWANAGAYIAGALLIVLTWPGEEDELSPIYLPVYVTIVVSKATFVWWWDRRRDRVGATTGRRG